MAPVVSESLTRKRMEDTYEHVLETNSEIATHPQSSLRHSEPYNLYPD